MIFSRLSWTRNEVKSSKKTMSASSGRVTSVENCSKNWMRSAWGERAATSRATSTTRPCSMPYTCRAPASAANTEQPPVALPMSTTTSPGRTIARSPARCNCMRTGSSSMFG
jgi:hypothetical protein